MPKSLHFPHTCVFVLFPSFLFLLARALSGVGFLYGLEIWYCCGKGASLRS